MSENLTNFLETMQILRAARPQGCQCGLCLEYNSITRISIFKSKWRNILQSS